jgi:predicted nucleic acid-binding Zn ribbon protein
MAVEKRRHLRREEDRRRVYRAALGYFIVLLLLFVGAVLFQRHTNSTIHAGLNGSCAA